MNYNNYCEALMRGDKYDVYNRLTNNIKQTLAHYLYPSRLPFHQKVGSVCRYSHLCQPLLIVVSKN